MIQFKRETRAEYEARYTGDFQEGPLDMKSIQRLHPEQAMLALAREFFGYRERANATIATLERKVHALEQAAIADRGPTPDVGALSKTETFMVKQADQAAFDCAMDKGDRTVVSVNAKGDLEIKNIPPGHYRSLNDMIEKADEAIAEQCGMTDAMKGMVEDAVTTGTGLMTVGVFDGFVIRGVRETEQACADPYVRPGGVRAKLKGEDQARADLDASGMRFYDEFSDEVASIEQDSRLWRNDARLRHDRAPSPQALTGTSIAEQQNRFLQDWGIHRSPPVDTNAAQLRKMHADAREQQDKAHAAAERHVRQNMWAYYPTTEQVEKAIEVLQRPNNDGIKPPVKDEPLAAPLSMAALSHAKRPL